MLGLMLHAHPRIAIPPENRFLLPSYFGREEFGDLGQPDNRRRLAEKIVESRRDMRNYGLDRDEMADRIVAESSTIGSACGVVLRAYAARFGKARWGDKRPEYRDYMWVIQRLFPDAQFVHLIRDGRDCVASLRQMPWWQRNGKGTYHAVQAWMDATDNARWARRELRADTYYELQYEHLVADPERQLTRLCEFLGEPFDEAMLSPQRVSRQVVPDYKTHHAKTRQEVSSGSVGNFAEDLEPWELQLCEAVMGDRLRDYGYELCGAAPPDDEHLEEYNRVDTEQRRRLRKQRQKDHAQADAQPVADLTVTEARQRQRIESLERQVASITAERDALRSRLDRTLQSRSWRWTQPLRKTTKGATRRRA